METKTINHNNLVIPPELKGIISMITEEVAIERIYLNKGTEKHDFVYRLNIITTQVKNDKLEQLHPVVNSIMEEFQEYSYRLFAASYAYFEIAKGNLYFLNNCLEKDLVYNIDDNIPHKIQVDEDPFELHKKIERNFRKDMSRLDSFRKGMEYFKSQKNLAQSAFMMHQSFEQGYRILEGFMCGKVRICHSIKNHQIYALKTLKKLDVSFQIESKSESKLLNLLEDAYSSTRYTNEYEITNTELEQLTQRLRLFIKEIQSLFDHELSVFHKNIRYPRNTSYTEATRKVPNQLNPNCLVDSSNLNIHFEMAKMLKSMLVIYESSLKKNNKSSKLENAYSNHVHHVLQLMIKFHPSEQTNLNQ